MPHRVCPKCGFYKGRKILELRSDKRLAIMERRAVAQKAKEEKAKKTKSKKKAPAEGLEQGLKAKKKEAPKNKKDKE